MVCFWCGRSFREIVGKVQSVEAVRSVNGRALKNFVVETNSRKRIACEAWGDGAELIDVVVKPDQVCNDKNICAICKWVFRTLWVADPCR